MAASSASSLRNSPSPDVLIVGAGIIGLSCAEALSRSGLRVEMWERRAAPALEASRASAGMLAPLAEVPEDRDFFDICRQARDLWLSFAPRLQEESGLPLDYDRSGALIADHPTLGLATLRAAAERGGEPWREIDGREAREWIPDLSPDIPRWLHLGGEHRVDNRRVCRALIARLRARGVILRTEHPLRGLRRDGGAAWTARGPRQTARAAHVILASGAWSRGEGTSPISGLPELPVHPVKGQMLRIEPVDWPFGGCLRCGRVYAARRTAGLDPQSPRGALLVGATVEPEA
ncbi:MAG: FAD-dependent oxidoreductase, partial [Acidobacteriota bacterium]